MSILNIKTYPARVLKEKAEAVKSIDGRLQQLIANMVETMYNASGVGLAAPQVGVSRRLIVVDTAYREHGSSNGLVVIINPEIVYQEGQDSGIEGCLSLPRFTVAMDRYARVYVRGIDADGNPVEIESTGLFSRALQHEIDHLNGVLLIDRLSPVQKQNFSSSFLKLNQ
ncbi:peptide deformylase [Candidatus Magnetobacterium bavaricum]|uniref:Peptide deformylase n=1 Tax=Candidatus Magnetobacterium bavaricum TaxID=29290 RepID=A0A0F3GUM5_9BACT|nr:peptide deformylase [Candidatus Magnetobacterium bavaricum]